MPKLTLYTTDGCHLCEQAEAMLYYILNENNELKQLFEIVKVDIVEHEQLVEQYGIRIPVICYLESEIAWPFGLEEFKDWLLSISE